MRLPFSERTVPAPGHFDLGGVKCSTHTIQQVVDEVRYLMATPTARPRTLLCVNAHIYNLAHEDASLRETLNAARVVTADGMSIVWLSRLWRTRVPERCNMTEAFRAFFTDPSIRPNTGVLIGVTQPEAEIAARAIEAFSKHCRIRSVYSGYLHEDEYDQIFRTMEPVDFIFIGMGTPRTERICEIARAHCPQAIVWGIGAGTIRILAGAMKEAPPILRRAGLQWLYRMWCEPRRLWRRYIVGNPVFLYRMLKTGCSARRTVTQQSTVPPG